MRLVTGVWSRRARRSYDVGSKWRMEWNEINVRKGMKMIVLLQIAFRNWDRSVRRFFMLHTPHPFLLTPQSNPNRLS